MLNLAYHPSRKSPLTQAELDQIAKALPLGIAVGDRYPDMSSVNR